MGDVLGILSTAAVLYLCTFSLLLLLGKSPLVVKCNMRQMPTVIVSIAAVVCARLSLIHVAARVAARVAVVSAAMTSLVVNELGCRHRAYQGIDRVGPRA